MAWWLPAAAGARTVDFLYVEPNAGNAGGGHFALRLDERVYHFQNAGHHWLRMNRVDDDWFRYHYSVQQNRTIHIAHLEVEDATAERLQKRLQRHSLVERRHFDRLAARRRDRLLLERIAAAQRGAAHAARGEALGLRGIGFFDEGTGEEPSLVRLRARFEARHGAGSLERRCAESARAIRALPLDIAARPAERLRSDRTPRLAPLLSETFDERTLAWAALDTIRRTPRLRPERLRSVERPDQRLRPDERARIEWDAERLETRVLELIDSPRPDWGYPALLMMARIAAAEASLERGRWVVLDAFREDAAVLPPSQSRGRRHFLEELEAEAEQRFDAARTAFAGDAAARETSYNDVEDTLNRLLELRDALHRDSPVRVSGEPLVPEGWAARADLLLPEGQGADLAALRERAAAAEADEATALTALYGYDLLERNCVTEILRAANSSGLAVDPGGFLRFVPAVAFSSLQKTRAPLWTEDVPSYRSLRLDAMRRRESRLAVFLRESNVLTSTVYRRNPNDSWFLFFTDDSAWTRPLFGVFNIAAGVAESAWGLVALPFAGTGSLIAGAKGVAFSLPELVFVNFQKGTLEYARSETQREPTPGDSPSDDP